MKNNLILGGTSHLMAMLELYKHELRHELTLTLTLTPTQTLTQPGARLRRTEPAAARREVGRRRPRDVGCQEAWRRRSGIAMGWQLGRSPRTQASRRVEAASHKVLSPLSHAKLHTPPLLGGKG